LETEEDARPAVASEPDAASGTVVTAPDDRAGHWFPDADPGSPFPIVGLGASAGGLEAIRRLLGQLPAEIGVALVVIQHLDPDRPSLLTSVLAGTSPLAVVEAVSGMRVERNHVYVIPSGADLTIHGGSLMLGPRRMSGGLHLPIDTFFRALAEEQSRRAIGVVLSGSGADGTEGLRAIKAAGGIAIVQSPSSAQFPSMPESAMAAGVVDLAAPPDGIAREIERLSRHPYIVEGTVAASPSVRDRLDDERDLAGVLDLVRHVTGIDFSGYKRTTVRRRIERRMALRRAASLGEYADAMRSDSAEAQSMARDMLIHVTAFFRDAEAFDALELHVFRELASSKEDGSTIRIWVPGCSTGEEVYSVAICLLEALGDRAQQVSIKIFGSDLSGEAVEVARAGLYSNSALTEVSPARLSRFFDRAEGGWRIGKRIRDLCIFVRHDLTRDPPFAKLDLICCRNLLIYLDADLQRRVIPMLHYCLAKPGHLFLGQSEAIVGFRDLFAPLDKEHRIFTKIGDSSRMTHTIRSGRQFEAATTRASSDRPFPGREAQRQADYLLLARFAPPGVLVDESLEILQFRGHTGAFLASPPGKPDANVLRMAREGLAGQIRATFERARAQNVTVRRENLQIDSDTGTRSIDLEVIPLAGLSGAPERFFLILFHELDPSGAVGAGARVEPGASPAHVAEPSRADIDEVSRLKGELVATKDYLRGIVAEHEGTTDELAAANEELVAANEELQSTNEELQSAKEELQSTNEELNTVNDELRTRNVDLDQIASDLVNVLASVDIPVIIVDMNLRVRRFTPTVRTIAAFIPEDIGRPIDDLKLKIKVDDLPERVRAVIADPGPREWEVEGPEGRWLRLQIRPYRTTDNRLDGAVLTFVDVDTLRRALKDAELARDYAKGIVETVTTGLVVIDARLDVVSANHAFYELFHLHPDDVEGRSFFEIGAGSWEGPGARARLVEAASGRAFSGLEVVSEFPNIGRKVMWLAGRSITWAGAPMTLVAIDDITPLRALEDQRAQLLESEKQARVEAERANDAKDLFLATLSHELRTPLSGILLEAQLLARIAGDDPRLVRASASLERAARAQARLINDLLDVSRIVSGKLLLDLRAVDLKEIVQSSVDMAMSAAAAKSLTLELKIPDGFSGMVYGDALRLQQVVSNLIANSIKFTPRGGRVGVGLERTGDHARITIADTGIGIRPEVLPLLFAAFVQADSSVTRAHGGLGLGLAIVRHLAEAHGGQVRAESPGEGKGSSFFVTLPLGASAPAPMDAALEAVARDISGVRVLLVDDSDDTRASFAAMLQELGADVRAVPSAEAGLAAVADFRPQVILSDVAMPGEDGFSFIRQVRRLPPERGGTVPAAALTALAGDDDKRRAREAGFQMHIAKPVDAVRLAGAVRTLAAMPREG
jgi:two-component system CheB/CheR fusion protein